MFDTLDRIESALAAGEHAELHGRIYFPWFGKECDLIVEDCESLAEQPGQRLEIERFLVWDDDLKARVRKAAYRYCERFCQFLEKDLPRGCTVETVLDHCWPSYVVVESTYDGAGVVRAHLGCAWEEEHGMEWVVRWGNELLYVGPNENRQLSDLGGDWNFAR